MSTADDMRDRALRPSASASSHSEFTPAPWRYRPLEYDDWGVIRSSEVGHPRIVARALAIPVPIECIAAERHLDAHRRAKTDPYEGNARRIVQCVNAHDDLVAALGALIAEIDEEAELDGLDSGLSSLPRAKAALAKARGESE